MLYYCINNIGIKHVTRYVLNPALSHPGRIRNVGVLTSQAKLSGACLILIAENTTQIMLDERRKMKVESSKHNQQANSNSGA